MAMNQAPQKDFFTQLMNHPAMQMGIAFQAAEGDPAQAIRINQAMAEQKRKQEEIALAKQEEEEFKQYILDNETQIEDQFGPGAAKMLYYRPQLAQTILPSLVRSKQKEEKEPTRIWAQDPRTGKAMRASDEEIRAGGLVPYERPKGTGSAATKTQEYRDRYTAMAEAGAGEKRLKAIEDAQPVLRRQNSDLQMIMGLVDEYGDSGALGEELLKSRKALDRLGFEVGDVDAGEMIRALGTQLQFAATAQLKGQITDREQMMARGTIPNIEMTPKGIKRLGKYLMSLNEREMVFNRFSKAYFGKVGSMDGAEGAFKAMQDELGSGVTFDGNGNFRINKKELNALSQRRNWSKFLSRDFADYESDAGQIPEEQVAPAATQKPISEMSDEDLLRALGE